MASMRKNEDEMLRAEEEIESFPVSPSVITNVLARLGLEQEGVLPDTSIQSVTHALQEEDWQIRLAAVRTLRTSPDEEADLLLQQAVNDSNEFVRMVAEHAMHARVTPILLKNSGQAEGLDLGWEGRKNEKLGKTEEVVQAIWKQLYEYNVSKVYDVQAFRLTIIYSQVDERFAEELRKRSLAHFCFRPVFLWDNHIIAEKGAKQRGRGTPRQEGMPVVILISPALINSDYLQSQEMQEIVEEDQWGEDHVIPLFSEEVSQSRACLEYIHRLPDNIKSILLKEQTEKQFNYETKEKPEFFYRNYIQKIRFVWQKYQWKPKNWVRPSARSVSSWYVPYARNSRFVGREAYLKTLYSSFFASSAMAVSRLQGAGGMGKSQALSLYGLGGMGKTQIALEYAYRYRELYDSVIWMRARTPQGWISDSMRLTMQLGVPISPSSNHRYILREVLNTLMKTQRPFLLILDDLEDISSLSEIGALNNLAYGHILLTTRFSVKNSGIHEVEVKGMEKEEGLALLLDRAQQVSTPTNRSSAEAIVTAVEALPLALEQVGAFIAENGWSVQEYLDLFEEQKRKLYKRRFEFSQEYSKSLAATIAISYSQIQQRNRRAALIFNYCCFIAPDAIPISLVNGVEIGENEDAALAFLQRYEFVTVQDEMNTFSIHSLVQLIMRDLFPRVFQQQQAQTVLSILQHFQSSLGKEEEHASWKRTYLQECVSLVDQYKLTNRAAVTFLEQVGNSLWTWGLDELAEHYWQQALTLTEENGGSPRLIWYDLANLQFARGNYEQAKRYYQRLMTVIDKQQRMSSVDNVLVQKQLGDVYLAQGQYVDGERYYEQALYLLAQRQRDRLKNILEKEVYQCLALLFFLSEKEAKAEDWIWQAVQLQRKLSPNGSSEELLLYAFMILVYMREEKYKEAEALEVDVLRRFQNDEALALLSLRDPHALM